MLEILTRYPEHTEAISAVIALGISLITILLLLINACFMAWQSWVFTSQSRGLWISIKDAKEKERRELAAYVFPKIVKIKVGTLNGEPRKVFAEMEIKNSGKTPAFNTACGALIEIRLNTVLPQRPRIEADKMISVLVAPNGKHFAQTSHDLVAGDPEALKEGVFDVFVHCFITWIDFYGRSHSYEVTSAHGRLSGGFGKNSNVVTVNDDYQIDGKMVGGRIQNSN